jgi:hypothetical protein
MAAFAWLRHANGVIPTPHNRKSVESLLGPVFPALSSKEMADQTRS